MKKTCIKLLCGAIIGMIILTGCHRKEAAENKGPESVAVASPIELDSVVVHKNLPGRVEADESVDVVAQVDGTIVQKCFKDGDRVVKGQVLYRLESKRYAASVDQAKASIASARSQCNYYSKQVSAMNRALAEDAVAKITVEQAESNLENARAQLAQAEAQLAEAQAMLGYCTITAPISGQTTAGVDNGAFAAAGQTKLCSIVNNGSLKVVFSIDEQQYADLIEEGYKPTSGRALFNNVPLQFGSGVKGVFTTDLYYTDPRIDPTVGAIMLEGKINNPDGKLRDGMYVTVELPMSTKRNALAISDDAIGTDQLGKYVYVVNEKNEVVYTPVKIGQTYQDTLRIIDSGLDRDARYVTTAMLKVRNGMKVHPVENKKK